MEKKHCHSKENHEPETKISYRIVGKLDKPLPTQYFNINATHKTVEQ